MVTYPTDSDEVAVAQASPVQEKLRADDSSTHESLADTFVEGSEGVTHAEFNNLRHIPDSVPLPAFLIVAVEFAERFSHYGTGNIYNNYIRAKLPPGSTTGAVPRDHRASGVAGALGMGQEKSFAIRTFDSFWDFTTPFIGAIIADCWWGRYKTIFVFSLVYLAGHAILTGSAAPSALQHPNASLGGLIVAILVMGLGGGAVRTSVSPLVAEQYTSKIRKQVLKSGETVIISPALTHQRIYLYFAASVNLGAVAAISAPFIARDHGYWIAFLIPTIIFAIVPLVIMFGNKYYVKTPPRGSVLLECIRVFTIAAAPRISTNPVTTWKNFKKPGFWDPAKPSSYEKGSTPFNITWDDQFVGEVARAVKACKVFCWFPFFWLCYSQINGNLGTVAAGMTLNGTPNDLIQNIGPISTIILIPIFDKVIYPALRKMGINFTPIKRIYAGFLVAGLAMLYSAILQKFIYEKSPCHDNQPSACEDADGFPNPAPINVWVIIGPHILIGIAEILAAITSMEYAFTKAPRQMRSFVVAFSQFQIAIAAALNFALTSVNVEERFTWLFGAFAITAIVSGTLFYFTFLELDGAEAVLNTIGAGSRDGFMDLHQKSKESHV